MTHRLMDAMLRARAPFAFVRAAVLMGALLAGCSSDATGPAPQPRAAYWALRLNYHAANLSLTPPYNTVRLTAAPVDVNGDTLAVSRPVTFTSGDSTVSVDSTGLVHANYETTSSGVTYVVATLQYHNVTLADTAAIRVTATPPATPVSTFSVSTTSGVARCNYNDGSSIFLDNCGSLVVEAMTSDGTSLSDGSETPLVVAYATSNVGTATVDRSGKIASIDTGHVTFTASTWAYGIVKRDSLRFVVDWPRWQMFQPQQITAKDSLQPTLSLVYSAVSVAAGGSVGWLNPFTKRVDIVFDDPSHIESGCFFLLVCSPSTGSGNIAPFYQDGTGTDTSASALGFAVRSFPVAGTYHFHSTLVPSVTGVIYVRAPLP